MLKQYNPSTLTPNLPFMKDTVILYYAILGMNAEEIAAELHLPLSLVREYIGDYYAE